VVQQARRDADLDVSDRIVVSVSASDEVRAAVSAYVDFVSAEVLADSVDFVEGPGGSAVEGRNGSAVEGLEGFTGEVGDGERVTVVVRRV